MPKESSAEKGAGQMWWQWLALTYIVLAAITLLCTTYGNIRTWLEEKIGPIKRLAYILAFEVIAVIASLLWPFFGGGPLPGKARTIIDPCCMAAFGKPKAASHSTSKILSKPLLNNCII